MGKKSPGNLAIPLSQSIQLQRILAQDVAGNQSGVGLGQIALVDLIRQGAGQHVAQGQQ